MHWDRENITFFFSIGALYDWSGNYNLSFYMAGTSLTLAGLICFPLRRISRWWNAKHGEVPDAEKTEYSKVPTTEDQRVWEQNDVRGMLEKPDWMKW